MRLLKSLLCLTMFLTPYALYAQGAHRLSQVIVKGNGIEANVGPYAQIQICVAGTHCSQLATNVYVDIGLTTHVIQPLIADGAGNYGYYVSSGCVDERVSNPGVGSFFIYNVCPSSGNSGGGSTSLTLTTTGSSGASTLSGSPSSGYTLNVPNYATGSGGVNQIVAGTNVTISPTNGLGTVTINATGGGGGTGPAAPVSYVQYNLDGTNFGSIPEFWDQTNRILHDNSTTVHDLGECYIPVLGQLCYWTNVQFGLPITNWDGTTSGSGNITLVMAADSNYYYGPGLNVGPAGIYHNGWLGMKEFQHTPTFLAMGIKQFETVNSQFFSIGDSSAHADYIYYDPGLSALSDEGHEPYIIQDQETINYAIGQVASTVVTTSNANIAAGQGPFSPPPTTNKVVVTWSGTNNGHLSEGTFLLDESIGAASGCSTAPAWSSGTVYTSGQTVSVPGTNIVWSAIITTTAGHSPNLYPQEWTALYVPGQACGVLGGSPASFDGSGSIGMIPVTIAHGTVPTITSWGATTSVLGDQTNQGTNDVPFAQSFVVGVASGSGLVPFATPNPGNPNDQSNFICIGGGPSSNATGYPETARVYSVSALSGGQQTITALIRKWNPAGTHVFQGGCGYRVAFPVSAQYGQLLTYWAYGVLGGNLIFNTQDAGTESWSEIFRSSTPVTNTSTFSLIRDAEIIANTTSVFQPLTGQIEDDGLVPVSGDILTDPFYPSGKAQIMNIRANTSQYSSESYKSSALNIELQGTASNFGPGVGAISSGYEPFVLANFVPCYAFTYKRCGGPLNPPTHAISISGEFGDIFDVSQPDYLPGFNYRGGAIVEVVPNGSSNPFALFNLPTASPLPSGIATSLVYSPGSGELEYSFDNGGGGGLFLTRSSAWGFGFADAPADNGVTGTKYECMTGDNLGAFYFGNCATPRDVTATIHAGDIYSNGVLLTAATAGGVASINGQTGAFTFTGSGVSCSTVTCTFTNGGGTGTVTDITTPSWPSWLTPSVTNPTTTPALSVTASAIPNSALAVQTANTVMGSLSGSVPSDLALPSCSGASNALTWISGTGFGCNTIAGGGSLTGSGTAGLIPLWSGSTALGNSPIDVGVTTAGTITATEPLNLNGSVSLVVNNTTDTTDITLGSLTVPSLGSGSHVAMGFGRNISPHNSTFLVWYNTSHPYGSFETYANGDPINLSGNQVWLNGGPVFVGNSNADGGSTLPSSGGLFNVGTTNQFYVTSAGGAVATSISVNGSGPGQISSTPTVVGSLPAASSVSAGTMIVVSDASTFTVGTCTGGGSDYMVAISNGSTWSCH